MDAPSRSPAASPLLFLSVASLLLTTLAVALLGLTLRQLRARPTVEVIALSQPSEDDPSEPLLPDADTPTADTPRYTVRLTDNGQDDLPALGIFDADGALVESCPVALPLLRDKDRTALRQGIDAPTLGAARSLISDFCE